MDLSTKVKLFTLQQKIKDLHVLLILKIPSTAYVLRGLKNEVNNPIVSSKLTFAKRLSKKFK